MKKLSVVRLLFAGLPVHVPMSIAAEDAGMINVTVDNDLFYGSDRDYTSGVRIIWAPGGDTATPEWVIKLTSLAPWIPREGEIRYGYALGQSMFTPSDITLENPPLDDRPYAGWLYGGIGLGIESGKQLDLLGLSVGVVGPASLAGQSQKFIHQVVGADEPQGWGTQLKNEPGLIVTYQHSWREYASSTLMGNEWDLSPHAGATLGNVFTYTNAGFTVRYGAHLPNDYGPPRILPGLPGSPDFSPAANFGWYLFTGIEGRVIVQNIFLDGNSFQDSRRVDKKLLVGDLQYGFVLDWQDIRLSYTHVIRTREFQGQDEYDHFGGFSVSFKL